MPRFYFHLVTGDRLEADLLGCEFRNLDAAHEEALIAVRDMVAERVHRGEVPLSQEFRITDDKGTHLLTVPFSEAVKVV